MAMATTGVRTSPSPSAGLAHGAGPCRRLTTASITSWATNSPPVMRASGRLPAGPTPIGPQHRGPGHGQEP